MADDERPDIPQTAVDREIGKAEQLLSDATKAREVGISKATIVNRLYFACFHGAQGALYAQGLNPQSHGQVQTMLGREFVQTGDLPREHGRFLNDMETFRRRVDYGTGGVERDAEDLIESTRRFLKAMRALTRTDSDD